MERSFHCAESDDAKRGSAAYRRDMARRPRIEISGATYHVTTRGNDRQRIYFGNWSGRLFVRELDRAALRYGWRVFAYCLMTNHYHVVLEIGERGLSHGMCELNGRFARATNWVNRRNDHVFGKRFYDRVVGTDDDWAEVCRYVLLNPMRSDTGCRDPRHWRWSSLRPTLGLEHAPASLDVGEVLGRFGRTPARGRKALWQFVRAGLAPPPVPRTG
jgi:REP element-mobilizing transposase RayT